MYYAGGTYVYDISTLGYQLKDPRYDTDYASTLLTLEDNQIKINYEIIEQGFVLPSINDYALVTYEYKSLGRLTDGNSILISQTLQAVREVNPPLFTSFSLQHYPIVDAFGSSIISNGVQFLDPNAVPPFSSTHPAFIKELPFKIDVPPARPGEYSVDYPTGTVYVYGAVTNDGTGNFSPVATYYYLNLYSSKLDYTFDEDTQDLVASPIRSLIGQSVNVSFNFENDLIPGIDYIAQIHEESINERINNNIRASNSLTVANNPITNVFRVFNETTGEIYTPTRWNDNVVYFTAKNYPRIFDLNRERVIFTDVLNEALMVNSESINNSGVRVFTVLLQNNTIVSATEDCIASSFNTSAIFSRADILSRENYFDGQVESLQLNLDRLAIGEYQVDYENGIVYIGVSNSQDYNLGTISYKKGVISPIHPHIISVSELYNSIDILSGINKKIQYSSVLDGAVTPMTFDRSDERFLNGDITKPYIFNAGTITVTDDIKYVRHIFDNENLLDGYNIIDFADGSTFTANIITLNTAGVEHTENSLVSTGNKVYVSIPSSINISSVASVTRISDGYDLYANGGSFSNNAITLTGVGTPVVGQPVTVVYNAVMNGAAGVIVDYNRGDYFMDYSYLADEILVSYEYGDNVLDFRASNKLSTGDTYYVSYKVGALRDALLKNFGTLVNLPIIRTFDTTLNRERYRDALTAALQSFTKGPTIPAIKSIVSNITKIDPNIIESIFQGWHLGISYLYPNGISTTGDLQVMPAKYDNGVLIDTAGQTITFPISSSLRLEQGTLETWVIPEWDGIDNDATLTFSNMLINSFNIDYRNIFIGASSFHPKNVNNTFTINRKDSRSPIGLPSEIFTANRGVFIYYDDVQKRWNVLTKGVVPGSNIYSGTISTSGDFYDSKFIQDLGEANDTLRTYNNSIDFVFNIDASDTASPDGYETGDGYVAGHSFDGITFMSDEPHYIFDFGETETTSRFSIYKDGQGYLNFRVFDIGNRNKINQYKVSADISNWNAGEKHYISTTWALNSNDRRDEMHLFIDGQEVPNIMRFGGVPSGALTDRFRTIKPEVVIGSVIKEAIAGYDLVTVFGSNLVNSPTINFNDGFIQVGDTIQILEVGFGTYTISNISGGTLTLSSPMPQSLSNVRFSINPFSAIVATEVDIYSNITVSRLRGIIETELPGLRATLPDYSISKNIYNQNVLTVLGGVLPGDQVLLRSLGLNHRKSKDLVYVWGQDGYGSAVLRTRLPPPIDLNQVNIIPIILPSIPIGPTSGAVFAGSLFTSTLYPTPINDSLMVGASNEGRTLNITISSSSNIDWSTPVSVTINGTTVSGPVSEVFTFATYGNQHSTLKFKTITSVIAVAKPLVSTLDSVSIKIKEAYSITTTEGNSIFPVIRFSYKTATGITLSGNVASNTVTDGYGQFVSSMIGDVLVIKTPLSVANTYTITGFIDSANITVSPALPATFVNGAYDIYDVTVGRSGFQNGFFYLELAGGVSTPYILPHGVYEFEYPAYLEIPFNNLTNIQGFVGSDLNGNNQAKAIIDEFRVLSTKLTDTRVGETVASSQDTITTDYMSLRAFKPDNTTLMLLHFDSIPFVNDSDFWTLSDRSFRQVSSSVNTNFGQSILFTDKPYIIDNKGIVTNNQGSIEFWVSPRYDTYNDPKVRYYFDAGGATSESVTSISSGVVKTNGRIAQIISVRLASDINNTGVDYFVGGSIGSDFQTISLGQALPYQTTPVKINYIPSGLIGDRMSIYKDIDSFIVFNVRAGGVDYQVRHAIFWQRDTWHRVRATFKLNRTDNLDELRLFVDGEERSVVLFGAGLLFGADALFGAEFINSSSAKLIADINFKDPLNELYLGSDYLGNNIAQARMDNLRISNIARQPIYVAGQPKDINYSMNTAVSLPVVPDAFTTYLLNFDTLITKVDDFALLKDKQFGIFDFEIDVIDSFDIVSSDAKIKQILEELVNALKPAQSRVDIEYI